MVLLTPSKIRAGSSVKRAFGCTSKKIVMLGYHPLKVRDRWVDYHDLYHLEVSTLERIQIGKDRVSGIHGIDSSLFHDTPITPEYDGTLDEIRVAFHECLTRPSFYNTLKLTCWMIWLMFHSINPLAVLARHSKSLKHWKRDFR